MHEKRLREIAAELATIETRANAIHTAVETAEQADLEQLNSEVSELETRQAALLAEKAKLEAEVDEARAFDESSRYVADRCLDEVGLTEDFSVHLDVSWE